MSTCIESNSPEAGGTAAVAQEAGPLLSVVVPVYNGIAMLEQSLAALAASDFKDFEVLVVDDGSTVPIEPLVARHGFRYMRIDGPGGPGRARNRGVAQVNGTYLVFVDADVCVHPDTLSRIAAAFGADRGIDAVVGTYDDSPAHPSFISQYKNLFHHYVHQSCHGDISTFWAGCGAIRRAAFLKCGGFDEKRYRRPAIEDIELGTWMSAAGHRIVLDRTVQGKHLKRWTFWNLLKTDVFDRGIPWTRLMLRASHLPRTLNVTHAQRISVALVFLGIMTAVAGIWRPVLLWATGGLVVAVTVLNWEFYRYFAARRGVWFTLRCVPLHWLYFVYCGFCFGWGTMLHYLSGDSRGSAPDTAAAS